MMGDSYSTESNECGGRSSATYGITNRIPQDSPVHNYSWKLASMQVFLHVSPLCFAWQFFPSCRLVYIEYLCALWLLQLHSIALFTSNGKSITSPSVDDMDSLLCIEVVAKLEPVQRHKILRTSSQICLGFLNFDEEGQLKLGKNLKSPMESYLQLVVSVPCRCSQFTERHMSNVCLNHSIPMSNGSFSNLKSSDRMGVTTTAAPRQKSATKKVNKWDAVMSKINYDVKPKPAINAKEVIITKASQPAQKGARNSSLVKDNLVVRHRQLAHLRNERNASGTTVRSSSLLIDNHENDRYSVQSSTESESSLQESSGTSSSRTRVKKNAAESYRQTSDLSSASDNSASQRRLNRTVVKNKGASRLATVTSLASSSSQSTNQIEPRTDRRKPITFASATPLNPGCKTVPSRMSLPFSRTAALHLKPLRGESAY
ncbi:unnamed protein product [Allacma fusca]|uniref:Uncharacterized protein n=1 Tax=Allacma fusca TaxID=39272 RepID=A0A8J2JYQ0_9HEXA|nr:unnamed protein product [Allacma fusca]